MIIGLLQCTILVVTVQLKTMASFKINYMGRGMTEKFDFFWNLRSNCAKGAERIDSKQASISKAMFINLVVI